MRLKQDLRAQFTSEFDELLSAIEVVAVWLESRDVSRNAVIAGRLRGYAEKLSTVRSEPHRGIEEVDELKKLIRQLRREYDYEEPPALDKVSNLIFIFQEMKYRDI